MHLKSPRIIKTAVLALYVRDGSCDTWKTGIDNLGQNDPYLDLDWPWEVTDVDVKGDVGVTSEGELLTGKTVSVFLDVGLRHNGHLLSRDGSSCWGESVCDQPTGGDGAVRAKTYHYECIITLTSQALVGRYYHGQTSFNFFWADRAKFYLVITSDLYLIVKETCGKKATDWGKFGMMSLKARTKSSIYTKLHKQSEWCPPRRDKDSGGGGNSGLTLTIKVCRGQTCL